MLRCAYYNEHDPYAAHWLRNLIAAGMIAPGDVDERDIRDVRPAELRSYAQCHFFAGIGVWSYALRLAGWPDHRPVWTGSCPCQPFSAAGKRSGVADERHLWPAFHWLIEQCAPRVVFGEQVASKDGLNWLDLVHADMEGSGYAFAALDLCAAGVGAPHIRQRLFFVADAESLGLPGRAHDGDGGRRECASGSGREVGGVGDSNLNAARQHARELSGDESQHGLWPAGSDNGAQRASAVGELAEPAGSRREGCSERTTDAQLAAVERSGATRRPGPTNGYWDLADWLLCTDGKWRPVEPGTQPLVDGSAFKLGLAGPYSGKSRAKMLRGYGNAIVAPLAAEFVAAAMEALP